VTCRKSRLYHSGAVAERLAAVVPAGPGGLYVRIVRDRCTLSVDTSGELLHRRGWRPETGAAPLRETLAAGILRLAGWSPGEALYDPMCGSGTLLIEAAVAAAGLAPGRMRSFDCERWCAPAEVPRGAAVPTIIAGGDRSEAAVDAARRNAERAGVEVTLATVDARHASAPAERGLVVCNPPYGRRARLDDAYRVLGRRLADDLATWRAAILCPDAQNARVLGRKAEQIFALQNGGLKVSLIVAAASR
jgi:putative N6-adenine-specific DNA methylase